MKKMVLLKNKLNEETTEFQNSQGSYARHALHISISSFTSSHKK